MVVLSFRSLVAPNTNWKAMLYSHLFLFLSIVCIHANDLPIPRSTYLRRQDIRRTSTSLYKCSPWRSIFSVHSSILSFAALHQRACVCRLLACVRTFRRIFCVNHHLRHRRVAHTLRFHDERSPYALRFCSLRLQIWMNSCVRWS